MEEQERQKLIEYCRSRIDSSAPFATVRKVLEIALRQLETMSTDEAGGWIEWGGGDCPVKGDTRVAFKLRSGKVFEPSEAGWLRWRSFGVPDDIVAYRIV